MNLDSTSFAPIGRALCALDRMATPAIDAKSLHRQALRAAGSVSSFERRFAHWAGVPLRVLAMAVAQEGSLQAAAHALRLAGADRLGSKVVRIARHEERPRGLRILWGFAPTPFGDGLFASTPHGLAHLAFCDSAPAARRELELRARSWRVTAFERDDATAVRLASAVFDRQQGAPIDLHWLGSAFRISVWQALLAADASECTTYGDLARVLRKPSAARAVGNAVGANRIGWLVPCHHVLRGDGGLGGFHWGVDRKRAMLVWESLPSAP